MTATAPTRTGTAVAVLDAACDGLLDRNDACVVIAALCDPRDGRRADALVLLMRAEDWRTTDKAEHGRLPAGPLMRVLEALLPDVPIDAMADGWDLGCGLATELAEMDAAGVDVIDRYVDGPVTDRRGEFDSLRETTLTELQQAAAALAGLVAS